MRSRANRAASIRTRRPVGTVRREAKAAGYVDPYTWEAILDHYRDLSGVVRCAYCLTARATERDHVVPVAKGGPDHCKNLVPTCNACNSRKGTQTWTVPNQHPWMEVRP